MRTTLEVARHRLEKTQTLFRQVKTMASEMYDEASLEQVVEICELLTVFGAKLVEEKAMAEVRQAEIDQLRATLQESLGFVTSLETRVIALIKERDSLAEELKQLKGDCDV